MRGLLKWIRNKWHIDVIRSIDAVCLVVEKAKNEQLEICRHIAAQQQKAYEEFLALYKETAANNVSIDTILKASTRTQESFQAFLKTYEETAVQGVSKTEEILKRQNEILKAADHSHAALHKYLDKNNILYNCPHEVRAIANNGFYEIRETEDYSALYSALIRGLDTESIRTVNQILCRHLIVRGKEKEDLDLFTTREKAIILQQRESFYDQILPLKNDLYTYDGALFPYPHVGMGWTETTVFLDKCGFVKVQDTGYVKDKSILDIGAFAGDSALVFSKITCDKVYAFEAAPANYNLLCRTIEVNRLTNVVPVMAAVGEKNGSAMISTRLSMGNEIAQTASQENVTEVQMLSIDDFVDENHVNVGMMKVDIEGFEMNFLKGAERTIRDQHPILLLSIYHTANDFFKIKPLIESWNIGYRFQIHKEVNEHIHFDTMLIAEVV